MERNAEHTEGQPPAGESADATARDLAAVLELLPFALADATLDLDSHLQSLAERIRTTLAADMALVLLDSPNGEFLHVRARALSEAMQTLGADALITRNWAKTNGIAGWVVETRRSALVRDTSTDPRANARVLGVQESVIAAPLVVRDRVLGMLRISALGVNRFGPADQRLVESLAMATGVAIENARLAHEAQGHISELEDRNRALQVLSEIGTLMLNSSESSTVADLILEKAMEVGPFDLGIVHLLRHDQLEPIAHRGLLDPANAQTYPLGTADRRLAMQNILARQEPLVVEDVPGYNGLAVYKREGVIGAVAVPLRAGSETLGVLAVAARTSRKITPALTQLLATMGSQLGVAIQKTRLYEETQQALADLERTEEGHKRLAAILEASPEFVGIADGDGHWLFINAAGRRLLGIGLTADIASLTMEQLTAPGGRGLLRDAGLPAATRDRTRIGETALAGADGSEIPVSQLILAHHDSSGRVEFFSTIARDLTEQRSIEQQLARAQRLETAGQVAGQVAHDFNNLLAPLVGYPELIKMRLPLGHPIVELCDRMLDAATRMAQINDDLLTLGRRGHFEHHALDLNALIRDAVAQMPEMPPSVVLDLDLGDELLPILGSGAQISRLLINLILNARDAMADVGRLTIHTRLHFVTESTGRAGDARAGEYICVEIADTGSGIPTDIRDRIFDVFFTTKHADQHRGTGMGLSIVQAVADDHHASVSLESAVGVGTTFRVLFPVYRGAAVRSEPGALGGVAASALIVDDDAGQRDVLAQLLSTLGFRVETVASGEEAVARLSEQPFDLITIDMVMPPGIDGVETYRRAKSIRPRQRTIIISAFAESDRVSEAQALGAGEYVRKPVTLDSLARAVRTELARGS